MTKTLPVPDTERVEVACTSSVDAPAWDARAEGLGGSFFHCHAYATTEAARIRAQPLFVEARDPDGACLGMAVGTILSPRRWPFSRYCRTALLGALPVTAAGCPSLENRILAALEIELLRRGVHQIEIGSYASPESSQVLSAHSYELAERWEFHLDLSLPESDLWDNLKSSRRTNIRKAGKLGVETRTEDSPEALRVLEEFQAVSLRRQGVASGPAEGETRKAWSALMDAQRVLLAVSYVEGKPINAALVGVFGGKAYYLHGGASPEGLKQYGPAHLVWSLILKLKAAGYGSLNLGGAVAPRDESGAGGGVFRFKNDFGGTRLMQPSGCKVLPALSSRLLVMLKAGVNALANLTSAAGKGAGSASAREQSEVRSS